MHGAALAAGKPSAPIEPEMLYRGFLSLYAGFAKMGVSPVDIDRMDLEDLFTIQDILEGKQPVEPPVTTIDQLMGM